MNNDRHPFYDLLASRITDWAFLYAEWERLRAEMDPLERDRHVQVMRGDRGRKLARIDRRLAELRAEIGVTQPRERYLLAEGKVIADTWAEFVHHWRFLQRHAAWPVGPSDERLADDERLAWESVIKGRLANAVEKIG